MVFKQYSLTYDTYDSWTLPLNLAIGFHILLVVSVLYLPGIFKPRPKFDDIYTVNLIEFSEPAPPVQPEPVVEQPTAQPEPEIVEDQELAPVLEPIKPIPPPPKEVKAVSIKPLKRKIKKKIIKPDNRQLERERLQRKRLAEALQAEERAAEEARRAAEEAERQQKLMEQQLATIKSQITTPSQKPSSRQRSSGAKSALETQYYATITNHVTQFWTLPEFKRWDRNLLAVVVVTVAQNGSVSLDFFEKRSGDEPFDQYVRKTIQEANPFPRIPAALKKNKIELGLRFTPEGIQ